MTITIRKAERKKAKLRLGISAPTGAGKTYSSLLIASGIGPKVGLIDTENGSGDLYADSPAIKKALPNGYDIINLSAPFDPQKYVDAIQAFEDAHYDVIIVDSLSHAWAGSGGSLDKQGKEADKTGNSYTAWRKITPAHNALVDKLLQSPAHIIADMRAKTEYVQEKNEQGKTVVRKVGMAPVMRDGIEYEFTVFGELDQQHNFQASKDRTGLFGDQIFVPSKKTGEMLLEWLNSGKEPEPVEVPLLDRAKTYADLLKGAQTTEELDIVIKSSTVLMGTLSKEEKALHKRLLEIIEDKRKDFVPKLTRAEELNDSIDDLNGLSQAEKLTKQLKGEAA